MPELDKTFSIKLDTKSFDQLDDFARRTERSRSAVVRLLIRQAFGEDPTPFTHDPYTRVTNVLTGSDNGS